MGSTCCPSLHVRWRRQAGIRAAKLTVPWCGKPNSDAGHRETELRLFRGWAASKIGGEIIGARRGATDCSECCPYSHGEYWHCAPVASVPPLLISGREEGTGSTVSAGRVESWSDKRISILQYLQECNPGMNPKCHTRVTKNQNAIRALSLVRGQRILAPGGGSRLPPDRAAHGLEPAVGWVEHHWTDHTVWLTGMVASGGANVCLIGAARISLDVSWELSRWSAVVRETWTESPPCLLVRYLREQPPTPSAVIQLPLVYC